MKKQWYFLLTGPLLALSMVGCSREPLPRISQGVAQLATWDRIQSPVLALDGEWEVYWGQFYTPQDFSSGNTVDPVMVSFPAMLGSPGLKEQGLHSYGYATL